VATFINVFEVNKMNPSTSLKGIASVEGEEGLFLPKMKTKNKLKSVTKYEKTLKQKARVHECACINNLLC